MIYEPIFEYFDFQRFKRNIKTGENGNERVKCYVRTMIGLWIPALFIVALVAFTDLSFIQVRFTMPAIQIDPHGPCILSFPTIKSFICNPCDVLYHRF